VSALGCDGNQSGPGKPLRRHGYMPFWCEVQAAQLKQPTNAPDVPELLLTIRTVARRSRILGYSVRFGIRTRRRSAKLPVEKLRKQAACAEDVAIHPGYLEAIGETVGTDRKDVVGGLFDENLVHLRNAERAPQVVACGGEGVGTGGGGCVTVACKFRWKQVDEGNLDDFV
jgi:hypothetical protein